jgi:hypothetical protein
VLPPARCRTWSAVGAAAIGSVVISPGRGVVGIVAASDRVLLTPEGLQIGWAATQVSASCPDCVDGRADTPESADVGVPGNPRAVYRLHFDGNSRVDGFGLVLRSADCPVQVFSV